MKTNIEKITEIMEFSQYGALAQVFIMNAVAQSAEHFAENRLDENGMISPDAWQSVAKEILKKLNSHETDQNQ